MRLERLVISAHRCNTHVAFGRIAPGIHNAVVKPDISVRIGSLIRSYTRTGAAEMLELRKRQMIAFEIADHRVN